VLLNGDAVATLGEMGLGALAGVAAWEWIPQGNGQITYEEQEEGDARANARASVLLLCSDVLKVTYQPGRRVETLTGFYNGFRARPAQGQTLVEGKVFVFPFGRFPSPLEIPPMLLNPVRGRILRRVLQNRGFPLAVGQPYLFPYCYQENNTTALYLVNAASDGLAGLRLQWQRRVKTLRVYASDAPRWEACPFTQEGDQVWVPRPLGMWEAAMLVMEW
jgi:hypothetical protein